MKKRFKVRWAESAEFDLLGIIDHIGADSPKTAKKIFQRFLIEAKNLTDFPEKGRIVPELERQNLTFFRELVIPPWRLIYKVSDDFVFVLAVFDSRQNLEDVLLKRLLRSVQSS